MNPKTLIPAAQGTSVLWILIYLFVLAQPVRAGLSFLPWWFLDLTQLMLAALPAAFVFGVTIGRPDPIEDPVEEEDAARNNPKRASPGPGSSSDLKPMGEPSAQEQEPIPDAVQGRAHAWEPTVSESSKTKAAWLTTEMYNRLLRQFTPEVREQVAKAEETMTLTQKSEFERGLAMGSDAALKAVANGEVELEYSIKGSKEISLGGDLVVTVKAVPKVPAPEATGPDVQEPEEMINIVEEGSGEQIPA